MKPSDRIKRIKRERTFNDHSYTGPNEKVWHTINAIIDHLDEQYEKEQMKRKVNEPEI